MISGDKYCTTYVEMFETGTAMCRLGGFIMLPLCFNVLRVFFNGGRSCRMRGNIQVTKIIMGASE